MSTQRTRRISQSAPCRIDLAGGTVDLWPLYLYLHGLELVNMAIDVKATADIAWTPGKSSHKISISSRDLKIQKTYESLDALRMSLEVRTALNPLRWVNRVVFDALSRNENTFGEWHIETRSETPPGSGLGGSSVLGISLAMGLEKTLSPRKQLLSKKWDIQQHTRDLEAVEIEHPAGDQDYVPALFGGLLIFKLGTHSREIERLPPATGKKIGAQSALLYTGKPHHSGLNNWGVFKSFHEGDSKVRRALKNIRDISAQFANTLREGELSRCETLINDEWSERQRLSPAISAPALDRAWSHARKHGAIARKACGAGGGGCLLVWFPSAEAKKVALAKALPDDSWKWLSTDPFLFKL